MSDQSRRSAIELAPTVAARRANFRQLAARLDEYDPESEEYRVLRARALARALEGGNHDPHPPAPE